jgi:hypothetical protein
LMLGRRREREGARQTHTQTERESGGGVDGIIHKQLEALSY